MRLRIALFAALAAVAVGGVGFYSYLNHLFAQLDQAFTRQDEFVPTRIFSDIVKIVPPQTRESIEGKLSRLNYSVSRSGDTIRFTLREPNYPPYLVPEGHPTLSAYQKPISLQFEGTEIQDSLISIKVGGEEISELYLEPELIATLARSEKIEKTEKGEDGESTTEVVAPATKIREYLKFSEIPARVWQAIIAVEDPHFLEHKGLDPRGLARAIWVDVRTHSLAQGGSTLTMQLVKNLMARRNKNIALKINELFLALMLEFKYDKEQILERYLNEVYLGQVGSLSVNGVAEGAKHFFGRPIGELNLAETALMAGLIRGTGFYSPYKHIERAKERMQFVIKRMVDAGYVAEEESKATLQLPVRLAPPVSVAVKAPYFTDYVKSELLRHLSTKMTEEEVVSKGFRIFTTLDYNLNQIAQKSVADGVTDIEKTLKIVAPARLEGSLAAVEPTTGYIRALVGGRSYLQSTFNRILNMKRQVGSTFKPFVYLAAIRKGWDKDGIPYGPAHLLDDSPWTLSYDHGKQSWSPKNYEPEYGGFIPMRTALAHSINIAAARLGVEIGLPSVIETARALGVQSDLPAVPSLSLGVAELSPIELLRAYTTIANHGNLDELTVIRAITENDGKDYARFILAPKERYTAQAIDLLIDMLQSVFTEGTAKVAASYGFDRPAAGKTGTTSQYRDAWFAGFTPQLVSVVWVGSDQDGNRGKTSLKLTGANSALKIWTQFMKNGLSSEPPAVFPMSPHLSTLRVDTKSGATATSSCPDSQVAIEKFIQGYEPKKETCESDFPASTPTTSID